MTSLGGEPTNGGQAVVIGASIAGLLAACALTDRFTQVIAIDRDILPSAPDSRRGVPQSRQAHGLLARGAEALDELLPGFIKEMIAAGGVLGDSQGDFHWYLDGYLMRQATSGLIGVALTRPAGGCSVATSTPAPISIDSVTAAATAITVSASAHSS